MNIKPPTSAQWNLIALFLQTNDSSPTLIDRETKKAIRALHDTYWDCPECEGREDGNGIGEECYE